MLCGCFNVIKGVGTMMHVKEKRHFIMECFVILSVFWVISFLVIFYRYNEAVGDQINFHTELMKSQSELLSTTVKGEVKAAIDDLVWYATDKSSNGTIIKDITTIDSTILTELLRHKEKYIGLDVHDLDGRMVFGIDNRNQAVNLIEEHPPLSNHEIDAIIFKEDVRTVLVRLNPIGIVELYTATSDRTKYIHLEVELQSYQELKDAIEKQFGYHVGLTSSTGELWKNMGDPEIELCVWNNCSEDGMFEEISSSTGSIKGENSIVVWACLICGKEIPYGVDEVVWINEDGQVENSIIALSSLSGQPFVDIGVNQLKNMQNTVAVVLFVQLIAAMVLGYIYHKYRQAQLELKAQATRDGLTGFLNRSAGFEVLRNDMALAEREEQPLTVAFIDIDDLKTVNDIYGHDDGDLLIQTISDALRKYVREADSLVRIGGDEFILILPNCEIKKANDILSRSLAWLNELNSKKNYEWKANFSYGLSKYIPKSDMTADELVQIADQKMYLHKASKRDKSKN